MMHEFYIVLFPIPIGWSVAAPEAELYEDPNHHPPAEVKRLSNSS